MEKILTNSQPDEPGSIDKEALKKLFESSDKEDKVQCIAICCKHFGDVIFNVCIELIQPRVRKLCYNDAESIRYQMINLVDDIVYVTITEYYKKTQTMTELMLSTGDIPIQRSIKKYLIGIADKIHLREVRKQLKKQKMPLSDNGKPLKSSIVTKTIDEDDLEQFLSRCPHTTSAFRLLYCEEYSKKEIIKMLCIKPATFRKQLQRVRDWLKKYHNLLFTIT